jgi:protein-L-isoaspartate(D-aspartate) O-methyltransferase
VTTIEADDLARNISILAGSLSRDGVLTDSVWSDALRAVPRHLFIPDIAWASPNGPESPYLVDRASDDRRWWKAVYSNTVLITQYDDGASDLAAGGRIPTCSNSAPSLVIKFLEQLSLNGHERVLEIGTGTGWTTALLSYRLGENYIKSIEIDPVLAEQAKKNVRAAGYDPKIIVADGVSGWADSSPYDRIHATCAVTRIPYSWIEQTRPSGIIVVPCINQFSDGDGHLTRLTVLSDGTAIGQFPHMASFMMLRGQRHKARTLGSYLHHEDEAEKTYTAIDPRTINREGYAAELVIGERVPQCQSRLREANDGSGEATYWLVERPPNGEPGSWAIAEYVPGRTTYEVEQYGERRLWDEVVEAYTWWVRTGRPGLSRLGVSVSADGQRLWLDHPENLIRQDP